MIWRIYLNPNAFCYIWFFCCSGFEIPNFEAKNGILASGLQIRKSRAKEAENFQPLRVLTGARFLPRSGVVASLHKNPRCALA
jgi:hypothetical protein